MKMELLNSLFIALFWLFTIISAEHLQQSADPFHTLQNKRILNTARDNTINIFNEGNQLRPRVASRSNGGFAFCWQSEDQDTSKAGIFAQVFSKSGKLVSPEFKINNYVLDDQINCELRELKNQRIVFVWQSWQQDDPAEWGIYGRVFNSEGVAMTNEFHINSEPYLDQSLPQIDTLIDGGFVAVWQSSHSGLGYDIYARVFNADGSARYNMIEMFTIHLKNVCTEPREHLSIMRDLFKPLTESKFTKEEISTSGIIDSWLETTIKYSEDDSEDSRDLRLAALCKKFFA